MVTTNTLRDETHEHEWYSAAQNPRDVDVCLLDECLAIRTMGNVYVPEGTDTLRDETLRSIGLDPHSEHSLSERITAFRHHWKQALDDGDVAKQNQLRAYAPTIGVVV